MVLEWPVNARTTRKVSRSMIDTEKSSSTTASILLTHKRKTTCYHYIHTTFTWQHVTTTFTPPLPDTAGRHVTTTFTPPLPDNILPLHSHHRYLTQMEDMLPLHLHHLYLKTYYHYIHTTVTWHRSKTTCYHYIHTTFTWHMRKTKKFNICLYLFSPRLSLISTQIFWLNSLDKIHLFYL